MKIKSLARTIILDSSGQVLLLRRARDDTDRPGEWDFPGGGVDAGETPAMAAVRETAEEANVALREDGLRLVYVMTSLTSTNRELSVNRFIFAAVLPEGQSLALSHEHEELGWFSVEDALRAFRHPGYKVALRYASENGLLQF